MRFSDVDTLATARSTGHFTKVSYLARPCAHAVGQIPKAAAERSRRRAATARRHAKPEWQLSMRTSKTRTRPQAVDRGKRTKQTLTITWSSTCESAFLSGLVLASALTALALSSSCRHHAKATVIKRFECGANNSLCDREAAAPGAEAAQALPQDNRCQHQAVPLGRQITVEPLAAVLRGNRRGKTRVPRPGRTRWAD
jgi:hypothetical protein